jgi:hypothetical protein
MRFRRFLSSSDIGGAATLPPVIASEAKQSILVHAEAWIASSLRFSQ